MPIQLIPKNLLDKTKPKLKYAVLTVAAFTGALLVYGNKNKGDSAILKLI
jgi:hypothetical protein